MSLVIYELIIGNRWNYLEPNNGKPIQLGLVVRASSKSVLYTEKLVGTCFHIR